MERTTALSLALCVLLFLSITQATKIRPFKDNRQCLLSNLPELDGFIAWQGTAAYNNSVEIDNGSIHKLPLAVVYPLSAQDVSLAIQAAQICNLPFSVRNGGHSAAGYCLNDAGVVLDVSHMNSTQVDPSTGILTQGTGGVWTNIYTQVAATNSGWVPIGGGCPTVGVTGFTLGGGFSFLSRSYGLAIDNLLEVTMVLANSSIITVGLHSTSSDEQDLFWALRGGGGGNFGVVVSLKFQMHQPSPQVLWGDMCWPVEDSTDILNFYNKYSQTVPDNLALYGWFGHRHGEQQFCLTTVYNGPQDEGMQVLKPFLSFNPPDWYPNYTTFVEFEKINGNATLVAHRNSYIKSGMILPGGLTPEVIQIFQDALKNAPSKNSSILWDHSGGAIARVDKDATAYAHRSAAYVYEVKAIWDTDEEAQANLQWIAKLGEDIAPFLNGAYLNYIDPLLQDWQVAYYGAHYSKLVAIKQKWDPTNFFTFKQSIGSNMQPPRNTIYPF